MQYSNQKPKIAESLVILLDEIKDLKNKNSTLNNDINELKKELNQFKNYLNQIPKNEKNNYKVIADINTEISNDLLRLIRADITSSQTIINSKILVVEKNIIEAVNNKKIKFL